MLPDCAAGPGEPGGRILFGLELSETTSHIGSVGADGSDFRELTDRDPGIDGAPSWSGDNRILFAGNRDSGEYIHLFAMDPDGRNVTRLTSGDGWNDFPSASPDGSLIAFEANAEGQANGIFLVDADGRHRQRLTTGPGDPGFDTGPDFSPDGTSIAYTRVLNAAHGEGSSAIFVVDVAGGEPRQLTEWDLNGHSPSWSPDGTRIAFSSNADNFSRTNPADIWIVNADGSGLTQFTDEPDGGSAYEPAWSPDGNWIAHVHFEPGNPGVNLTITDITGTNRCVAWRGTGQGIKYPDWGPGGD